MVGTVKKSTDTRLFRWLSRKVRQVCDGGFRFRTRYLLTLVSPMLMASLSNSPWMRGAPQPGFSLLKWRMRLRISRGTAGRPGLPRRTFHVQNSRNALRCQAMTVSGLTIVSDERQSCPHAGEPDPQESVRCVQLRALVRGALKDTDLVAERNVLQLQRSAGF